MGVSLRCQATPYEPLPGPGSRSGSLVRTASLGQPGLVGLVWAASLGCAAWAASLGCAAWAAPLGRFCLGGGYLDAWWYFVSSMWRRNGQYLRRAREALKPRTLAWVPLRVRVCAVRSVGSEED
jgi:hypothetical protein